MSDQEIREYNPVLCIPRVYPNINEVRIRKIFDQHDMGIIDHIDIVSIKPRSDKKEKMNRVFVHYREWNNSDNANVTKERLLNGKDIKIIYNDPWLIYEEEPGFIYDEPGFWKVSEYRESDRKPMSAPKHKEKKSRKI